MRPRDLHGDLLLALERPDASFGGWTGRRVGAAPVAVDSGSVVEEIVQTLRLRRRFVRRFVVARFRFARFARFA